MNCVSWCQSIPGIFIVGSDKIGKKEESNCDNVLQLFASIDGKFKKIGNITSKYGHLNSVKCLDWTSNIGEDCDLVASGSLDTKIIIWSLKIDITINDSG